MKTQSHNLRFMVITILLLTFLPTGFTQNVIEYSYFTYQEKPSIYDNLTEAQPQILGIKHYSDNSGTAIVRVARMNYFNYFTFNYCYEQRLLLRVIQANGSVIEINYINATEIQDINYCMVESGLKNPINFYPLFDQYILVTYTHATNTSDNTTYTDRGMVFDWSGNVISKLDFGQSYLSQGTIWIPNENIVNNITPQKGFLRLSATTVNRIDSWKWAQYQHNGNGMFSLLQNDTVLSVLNAVTSVQVTVFATLNDGYAIVYANTTNSFQTSDPLSALITAKAGIYAILLGYNQTRTSQRTILYEMITSNLTFANVYCSVDYAFTGHTCIISVQHRIFIPTVNVTYSNVTTTTLVGATTTAVVQVIPPVNVTIVNNTAPPNITTETFYIKIRFLSTGSVISLDPIIPPNKGYLANFRTLPFGGYALISRAYYGIYCTNYTLYIYDENDNYNSQLKQIIANFDGAFDILQNNTNLVALNGTTTSWKILSIVLPQNNNSGYGNIHVSATYPPMNATDLPLNTNKINITFNEPISFSEASLTIYQKIDQTDIVRQFINSSVCSISNGCIISGVVLTIKVLNCTFNDPGGHYYIQMDNNFVKNDEYSEPLLGIDPNTWSFQTGDIRGMLRLTDFGSQYFQRLNDSENHDFFVTLINELTLMIPIESGRLGSNKYYQLSTTNVLIPLFIRETKDDERLTAADVKDNLHQLILNKAVTGISRGNVTKFLDDTYGFQQAATYAIYKGTKDPAIGENFQEWIIEYRGLVIMFIILIATDYEYLTILEDKHSTDYYFSSE
ncbi:11432_t:CDS:2, partial [Dentiscutata heterogama]